MRFLIILVAYAAILVGTAHADEAETLTLADACRLALQNHPNLRAARLLTQAEAEGVNIARSSYFPQVNGSAVRAFADPGTRIGAPGGINDPTVIDRGSLGIGVSQLITDFGRTANLISSSKLRLQAQQDRTALTAETVVLNATRAYFGVLGANALMRVAEETQHSRRALLDQVSALRNSRLRSDLDLSIAEQGLSDANLLLLRARTAIGEANATLAEALGLPSVREFALTETSDTTPPPGDLEGLLAEAAIHNPDLQAIKAQAGAARKLATAEHAAKFPTVSAVGYVGTTPQQDAAQTIHSNYAAGGLTLDVPLFTGGRLSSRAHQASLQADALDEAYDERRNVLTRDVSITYGDTQTAFQNISVTDELRRNAETTLDLTQTRYNIGKSSIVDLNQAQLAATQAEIVHTEALYAYRIQSAQLAYETGRLTADAIQ